MLSERKVVLQNYNIIISQDIGKTCFPPFAARISCQLFYYVLCIIKSIRNLKIYRAIFYLCTFVIYKTIYTPVTTDKRERRRRENVGKWHKITFGCWLLDAVLASSTRSTLACVMLLRHSLHTYPYIFLVKK